MFRSPVVADPPSDPGAGITPEELIQLSHLALDLSAPADWSAFLADRGIEITIDDIGRAAITRDAARDLLTEKRQAEAQAREHAAVMERRAIEQDRQFRASLGVGLPAAAIPHGMTYGELIAAAELDSQQYRPKTSMVEDLLSNDGGIVFHPIVHEE
jgi:hypothetical protein